MFKNILVAFDGSSYSIQAAKFGAEICKTVPGATCTLITVITFTRDEAQFLGTFAQEYEKMARNFEEKHYGKIKNYFKNG